MDSIYTCTPDEAKRYIIQCIKAGIVPYVRSSPGIGKSAIVKEISKEYGLQLIDFRLSMCDPVDFMGLPDLKDSKVEFKPMKYFPLDKDPLPEGKSGWLLFFDEFNAASRSIIAAAYKIVLDRMIGMHNLHSRCVIVCAGNEDGDKAITNNIGTAMQSRLVHIHMQANFNNWLMNVALPQKYDSRIIAYLSMFNDKLMLFNPDTDDCTFACPRTWEFTNKLLKGIPKLENEHINLLVGTIGESIAPDFVQFTKIFNKLVKFNDIVKDPVNCDLPQDAAECWALISSIMTKLNDSNISKVCVYTSRFDMPFRILFYNFILKNHPEWSNHKDVKAEMLKLGKDIFI